MSATETNPEQPMRVIELRVSNIKRIKAARIKMDGSMVRIEGRNEQGKSSLLDAFEYGIAGGRHLPTEPVRRGCAKGTIGIDLGTEAGKEFVIKRTLTAEGSSTLEVTNADGVPQKSPQALLDSFFGQTAIDPECFVHLKQDEQVRILKKLVGLDFSALDAKRETIYHKRTQINRDLRSAQAGIGDPPVCPADLPDKPVSLAELTNEFQAASKANHDLEAKRTQLKRIEANRDLRVQTIARMESELATARAELAEFQEAATNMLSEICDQKPIDVSAITTRMQSIEKTNALIAARAKFRTAQEQVERLSTEAQDCTSQIEAIDHEKTERLAKIKFPYPGLSINQDGVTLDGLPFEQASSAAKLRASVAIGFAEKPRLRFALVREGSRLDANGIKLLAEIVAEYDGQVLVERVSDTKSPAAFYIEDGEVVSEPTPE